MILGLRLIVEGEAGCKWTESAGNNRRATTYHGEEKYLESVTYLFGSKDSDNMEVQAGIHTYNFVCQLPMPIPHSAEGEYGYVRYKVNVNLDISWGFDLQAEKVFTVVRREDLNLFPELRLPCELEEIKTFCCWFCKSEPLLVKVRLPKTGFALGEKIPISVEMINKSNTNVSHTTYSLKRVDTFTSESPSEKQRVVKQEIVDTRSDGVKAGETVNIEEFVEIPQVLVISNHRYCKVFRITYELKITAETEGVSVSPEIHIPITIGIVGLTSDVRKCKYFLCYLS